MIYRRSFLGISIARRSNRRWLIAAYWTISISFTVGAMVLLKAHPQWSGDFMLLFLYVFLFTFSGLGRMVWDTSFTAEKMSGGIRTLFETALREQRKKGPPMDEREKYQWDKAYRSAYGYMGMIVFLSFILHVYNLIPWTARMSDPRFWFLLLVYVNLPQSILLWNEPDMEEPQ